MLIYAAAHEWDWEIISRHVWGAERHPDDPVRPARDHRERQRCRDHGYLEDAGQMRKDSCEAIRSLMAEHVFLRELFPTLLGGLDSGRILLFIHLVEPVRSGG
jgi:hypothetical protein